MIRINLVQTKQPSVSGEGVGGVFQGLMSGGVEGALTFFKTVGIPLILCVAANYGYDYYASTKTDQMAKEIASLDKEKDTINKELQKIKGFEAVKVELERNELILRAKIDTIEKLIRGRDFTVKALVTLSQAMPRDIWLTEMNATETTFDFKGGTIDLSLVSDFMTKLGQTIYFKEVTLKGTSADPNGKQANFDLGAKRE